jgi:hypothetical protein
LYSRFRVVSSSAVSTILRTFSGYLSYPAISPDEIVAGAPFFFGEGDPEGFGDSLGAALALGDAEGEFSGEGLGVGEPLCFFFLLGLGDSSDVGVGELFFFFFGDVDALPSGVSDGVGVALAFFFGDADFSGEALGLGVGDFSVVAFFFLCGVGVGVGANIFFSFVPKDCSAGARTAQTAAPAKMISATAVLIMRRID